MIPEEELRRMYCDEGMTQKEIGDFVGVSGRTISQWMRDCGMLSRIIYDKPSKGELHRMYWDESMTQQEIADCVGTSLTSISMLMKMYGIKTQVLTHHRSRLVKPSKEVLEKMYFYDRMSHGDIGSALNVTQQTVCRWFKSYGFKSRTFSEARIGKFIGENHPCWKGGISGGKYCYKFSNKFREAVRKRDDYTCQLCGFEQDVIRLDVHHVHYYKEDCYPDVVTLCRSCHSITTAGDRDYWEEYFENQLLERGLIYWSLG